MITIKIPKQRLFDDEAYQFVDLPETVLDMEHSLLSLEKWEAKYHKPFLSTEKSAEEVLYYLQCMTIGPKNVDPRVYLYMPKEEMEKIMAYIKDPATATTFSDIGKTMGAQSHRKETVTAEIIYYWMITLNIPIEFRKWNINRLLTLIKVVNIKNGPAKKMSPMEAARQRHELNEIRKKKYNTKG